MPANWRVACSPSSRVTTEGLFGLRPAGMRSFTIAPKLPSGWNEMALNHIAAFGGVFDLEVKREGNKTRIILKPEGEKPVIRMWDGKAPVHFNLNSK